MKCTHCDSTDLIFSDDKQGFGAGKAVLGAVLAGPIGLLAGFVNKNKRHVYARCNSCMKTFEVEKVLEEKKQVKKRTEQNHKVASMGPLMFIYITGVVACLLAGISYVLSSSTPFMSRFLIALPVAVIFGLLARKGAREKQKK